MGRKPLFNDWRNDMAYWHNIIKADTSKIIDFVSYFEAELVQARADVKIKGSLEQLAANLPGIVEHRFRQLQEGALMGELLG